jgi:hypothetical protein
MADQRSMTGGRFQLSIENWDVGFLKKFSGLAMEADVVANDLGPANVQKKHVSNIKWTEAKATVGIGMGYGMYQWIQAAFDRNYMTKDGTFKAADFNHKAMSQLDFFGGLITGVTCPKMDGSSKDAAYFDVSWDVERVRWHKGDLSDVKGKIGPKQKQWLCSNFRFDLQPLPTNRVATIDSWTWKCGVSPDQIGITREPTKHPSKVTVPDLKISISSADHEDWAQKAKSWFVDGHHTEADEMAGAITFLGPDMKEELGRVELMNVGFKKFSDEDMEANSEKIKRFNVELYVEHMKFHIKQYDA